MYEHKVLRVNYTTYDMRVEQDSLNPRTRSDIIVLAPSEEHDNHPYWYARVIGIYHVHVLDSTKPGPRHNIQPQHMEFLWVRWYGLDMDSCSGFKYKRLPHVGFMDCHDPETFGFIDPALVL